MMSAVRPTGRPRPKGKTLPVHPQVQLLLDGMAQAGGPPLDEMSPADAREVFRGLIALDQPEEVTRVDDRLIPGDGNDVPVRVYTPADAVGGNAPLLIWIHGGGWVIGDLDTADATARALANRSRRRHRVGRLPARARAPGARRPRGLPRRAHLVRRERRAPRGRRQPGRGRAATPPAATSPRASASGCATTSGPTSTSSSSCTPSPTARCSSRLDGRERRGVLPHQGLDGVVRRPLRRRRRPEGLRRVAAPRRLARRPSARAGDHRRVRSAARRGRGVRRRSSATPACRWSWSATTARSTASSAWPASSRTAATRSTAPARRCEPPSPDAAPRRVRAGYGGGSWTLAASMK